MIGTTVVMAIAMTTAQASPTCPLRQAEALVGLRYDDLVGARPRRPGATTIGRDEAARRLSAIRAEGPLRWIMPGSSTTQDHVPTRVNLEVGDDGMVLRARCG